MRNKKIKSEYLADRKSIMTLVSMSFAFLLVIVLTFGLTLQFQFDNKALGNLAISFALSVYSLYFGIPEAKDYYQKKREQRYQQAVSSFKEEREETSKRDGAFNQWLEDYYQKNKRDYFKIMLSLSGSINTFVLDLDLHELHLLDQPFKKNWDGTEFEGRPDTYFRSHTKDQIEVIRDIFKGKVKVEKIPDDFFKTYNGRVLMSEYVEQAKFKDRASARYAILIVYRLIMLFAISLVLAAFVFDTVSDSQAILNSIITLVGRIWTIISSFTYGFAVGKIMVMDEAAVLEYKARVNKLFNNDTTFVAIDEEALAVAEYEAHIKNTVVPEVVDVPEVRNTPLELVGG